MPSHSKLAQSSVQQFAIFAAEYPHNLRVLVVGDGDFAFSNGLARSRYDGKNITATSFQTRGGVTRMYRKGAQHIRNLIHSGVSVLFQVDARVLRHHPTLSRMRFDRIIFNFPHAGFLGAETKRTVIAAHQDLLGSFFRNAAALLTLGGEVHVTHKTNPPYDQWNIVQLANDAGLENFETCAFDIKDYPGYVNKRGDGRRADKSFKLGDCAKFKFKRI